jgi:hypothetical protein
MYQRSIRIVTFPRYCCAMGTDEKIDALVIAFGALAIAMAIALLIVEF